MEELKDQARERGLWNLFHPHAGPDVIRKRTLARGELRRFKSAEAVA
jgi:hypothetical protein